MNERDMIELERDWYVSSESFNVLPLLWIKQDFHTFVNNPHPYNPSMVSQWLQNKI